MIKTAIGPAFLSFSNVKLNKLLFGLYFIIYLFLSSVTQAPVSQKIKTFGWIHITISAHSPSLNSG